MKNLLITGASGFLGWNIIDMARKGWSISGTYYSHEINLPGINTFKIDLGDFMELKGLFNVVRPDAVIHTAAISDVNLCQENPSETYEINTRVSMDIAGICSDLQIPCLFISSDLVFDGLDPPYSELDQPCPVSVYGEQKVLAEKGMKERYPSTVICRVPLMFGDPGPVAMNFVKSMIEKEDSGAELNLFIDEFRTPISGRDAARSIMHMLEKGPDLIHLGGQERISRYDFGMMMKDIFNLDKIKINPCKQKDINLAAPRPSDVSLNNSKARDMGFEPDSIRDALEKIKVHNPLWIRGLPHQ